MQRADGSSARGHQVASLVGRAGARLEQRLLRYGHLGLSRSEGMAEAVPIHGGGPIHVAVHACPWPQPSTGLARGPQCITAAAERSCFGDSCGSCLRRFGCTPWGGSCTVAGATLPVGFPAPCQLQSVLASGAQHGMIDDCNQRLRLRSVWEALGAASFTSSHLSAVRLYAGLTARHALHRTCRIGGTGS